MPFPNPAFKWQRSVNNGVSWTDIPGANAMNAAYTENTAGIYNTGCMPIRLPTHPCT